MSDADTPKVAGSEVVAAGGEAVTGLGGARVVVVFWTGAVVVVTVLFPVPPGVTVPATCVVAPLPVIAVVADGGPTWADKAKLEIC